MRLVRDRNTPQKIVWRSQIVLLSGEGIGAVEVATRVGKSVLTVRRELCGILGDEAIRRRGLPALR